MIDHALFSPLLAKWRADTPACEQVVHLNNAGAALPPQVVTEAMTSYLSEEAALGGYELAAKRAGDIATFYPTLARLIGAKAHQIAFSGSATDSYNRALSAMNFRAGELILTTADDYVSNQIAFLQLQQNQGVKVIRASKQAQGGVDPEEMRRLMLTHKPRLVAVTHVPTSSGLVQDIEEIGRYCRELGIYYLVDACQSAGQLPLDVEAIGCDFLSATFRKYLRGPRGAGFLFVSDRVLAASLSPSFLDLHSAEWVATDAYQPAADARRFELWERNYALVLGATAAADYALEVGIDTIADRVSSLARYTREQLAGLPRARVLDQGSPLCGIVTVHFSGIEPAGLLQQARARGIHTSVGTLAAARLDFGQKGVTWALRISPHYYNTQEEIDLCVATLAEIVG